MYSLLDSVVCGTKTCTLKKLKLVSRLGLGLDSVEFGALSLQVLGVLHFLCLVNLLMLRSCDLVVWSLVDNCWSRRNLVVCVYGGLRL